jgi:hypothetical protein
MVALSQTELALVKLRRSHSIGSQSLASMLNNSLDVLGVVILGKEWRLSRVRCDGVRSHQK